MKTTRNKIEIIVTNSVSIAEYFLLLCKMMEAVSTDDETIITTKNVA